MTSQMRDFMDETGPLWASGALAREVGLGAYQLSRPSTVAKVSTMLTMVSTLLHYEMVVVVGCPSHIAN